MLFFCFSHLRWCHNGWASNILSGGYQRSKYWMPIHYDTIEHTMGKTKNLIYYMLVVMTSFDHVMIPTSGNWFQTNPVEHESDDRAGNTVFSLCVTNGKDMALQRQIWSTFVTVLWFRRTKIQDGRDIGSCECLVSYDFQNLQTILARFLQIHI